MENAHKPLLAAVVTMAVVTVIAIGGLVWNVSSANRSTEALRMQLMNEQNAKQLAQAQVATLSAQLKATGQQPAPAPTTVTVPADAGVLAQLNNATAMKTWTEVAKLPAGSKEVAKLPQALCPPNPDGPCGADYTFTDAGGMLYVSTWSQIGTTTYGPIGKTADLLPVIKAVSQYVKTLEF